MKSTPLHRISVAPLLRLGIHARTSATTQSRRNLNPLPENGTRKCTTFPKRCSTGEVPRAGLNLSAAR